MKIFKPFKKIAIVCLLFFSVNIYAQGLSIAVDGASTAQSLSIAGTASPVSCYGGNNGSISVLCSGGSPTYQYSWYDNGANTSTRNNLSAGTYSVQVRDNVNCVKVQTYTITEPINTISLLASATNAVICAGNSTSLSASATGGTGAFTYTWDNGVGTGASVNVNPTTTTNYTVTATDANGCTATSTKTINVNLLPTATTTGGGVVCAGGTLPNVVFTFTGTPPYNFSYSNGTTVTAITNHNTNTYTITNAPIGTYNVTALTDANACNAISLGGSVNVSTISTQNAPTIAFALPASTNNTLTVCSGTVKMSCTTSGVAEYLWYKNGTPIMSAVAPNNSYIVNTNASGSTTYTLAVVYAGTQCLSAISAPLTIVNATPTATITPTGPTTFCPNVPTILNANIGANYSYVWKTGATIVQVGGASFAPTASGTYNLTVKEGASGCSKTSANVSITIKTPPIANAGADQSTCAGSSIQIGTTGTAGNTYTWSPSAGISNIYAANPTASPSTSTTYTVTVKNATTGCTNTDAVVVTRLSVPPTPTLAASSAVAVCEGTSVTLTPSSPGAVSLNWYKNGLLLSNLPINVALTVSAPTAATENYTLKSKGANGCLSSFSNYKNVWIKPAATPTITSVPAAVGNIVTLCVPGGTTGNATLTANTTTTSPTYSWKLGTAFIAGANASTYLANVTTTNNNKVFSVQATYANGCVKTSVNTTVKLVTIGCSIKDGSTKDHPNNVIAVVWDSEVITAYPNPTDGLLNVNIQNCEANKAKLLLYNALGQVVAERSISITNGKASQTLDLREMAKGVYTLSFQTEGGQKVQKVIKE